MDVIYRLPQRHQQQTWLRSLGISLLASILAAASAAAQEVKIEFQVLTVPPNLNISDSHSNAVIRSNRDWTIWVGNLREVPDSLPSVDFEKYTLLISNAGYKSNGPYEVKFDSVTDLPNEVRVHISVTGPVSCPAEPEAAHYVAMAVVPRTDKPVQFDVTTRNSICPHR